MRKIKVVIKKVGDEDRYSVYATGKYTKKYRPRRWVQVSKILEKVGYGLCVFEFPDDTPDEHIYASLGYMTGSMPSHIAEVWEVEAEGKMRLPERRLQISEFRYVHPKQIPNATKSSLCDWPQYTATYRKIKLVKKIGALN